MRVYVTTDFVFLLAVDLPLFVTANIQDSMAVPLRVMASPEVACSILLAHTSNRYALKIRRLINCSEISRCLGRLTALVRVHVAAT